MMTNWLSRLSLLMLELGTGSLASVFVNFTMSCATQSDS